MNIIKACEDPRFFKPLFKDLRTWGSWLTFLKVLFALPLTDKKERRLFRKYTGRRRPPRKPAKEVFAAVGRRSGKSFISAIIAVFLACFKNWQPFLAPGERGFIFIIAVDKAQAAVIRGYISAILHSNKTFEKMIGKETMETIDLVNNVSIMIKTASYRSIRGYTILVAILDEIAFLRSEESANPDREILTALRPALATIPESLLIAISTPYSRSGVLWEMYSSHFGSSEKDAPLLWRAKSLEMNPTLDEQIIKNALKEDYAAAQAEWLGEFREDLENFLSPELIEQAVVEGRIELLPMKDVKYFGFCDPSGGRQDSMTLAIAHRDSNTEKIILDVLREIRPPFKPSEVVRDFSGILKAYEIGSITSDRYGAEWVSSSFRDNGIMVENSELTTSEIYLNFLPLISNNSIELLDSKRLVSQFRSLERRTRPGGKDLVTHYAGGHDDLCNSCAGALLLASRTENFRLPLPSFGYSEPDETLKEKLDRESRLWLSGKPIKKDEPEIDESFWKINEMSALDVLHEVESFDKKK